MHFYIVVLRKAGDAPGYKTIVVGFCMCITMIIDYYYYLLLFFLLLPLGLGMLTIDFWLTLPHAVRFNILQQRCLVASRPGKHHQRVGNHCTCRRWKTNRHDFSEVGHHFWNISWSRGGIERPVPNRLVVKQLETIQIRVRFLVGAPRNQDPLFGFGILESLLASDFGFRILDWSPLFIWHPQGPFGFWILHLCPRFDFAYEYAWLRRLGSADYI